MLAKDFFAVTPSNDNEVVDILLQSDSCRIQRIVSCGQSSPLGFWYDQDEDEWLILLQGKAGLLMEGGQEISLSSGQHLFLPAHQKHRLQFTSTEPPCIWLCVFADFSR